MKKLSREHRVTHTRPGIASRPFFVPIYYLRSQLWQAKRNGMVWIDGLLNNALVPARSEICARQVTDTDTLTSVASVLGNTATCRDHIYRMRILPFDASTFKRFLVWAYAPLVSLILPYLPEGVRRVVQVIEVGGGG